MSHERTHLLMVATRTTASTVLPDDDALVLYQSTDAWETSVLQTVVDLVTAKHVSVSHPRNAPHRLTSVSGVFTYDEVDGLYPDDFPLSVRDTSVPVRVCVTVEWDADTPYVHQLAFTLPIVNGHEPDWHALNLSLFPTPITPRRALPSFYRTRG